MPDPLMVPGAPGVPGAEAPGQPTEADSAITRAVETIHAAYCSGPTDLRCLTLRSHLVRAVRRVYGGRSDG